MARYTGPKTRISRRYNEPIFGDSKTLAKKNYPAGQHGKGKKRKQDVLNIPSAFLRPGDVIAVREKSKSLEAINNSLSIQGAKKYNWLEWDMKEMEGKLINLPPRQDIPENINEQLIVELYSK